LKHNKLHGRIKELSYFEFGVVNSKIDSTYILFPGGYFSGHDFILEFNENGYIVKKTFYTPELETFEIEEVSLYVRDKKNRIVTEYKINYTTKDTLKITYNYKEKIPKFKKYKSKLKIEDKYIYDSNNNWIEKKSYYKGKLWKVFKRKITYY